MSNNVTLYQTNNAILKYSNNILYLDIITNVLDIAYLEYNQKKLPFIIERKLPNNKIEYWKLSDLSDIK